MTRYTTASGSIYDVDHEHKLVRRIGDPAVTNRALPEWTPYERIDLIHGVRLLITWPEAVPLLPGSPSDMTPATLSSLTVTTEEDYAPS